MKNGFHLSVSANSGTAKYFTYDEVKNQVAAQGLPAPSNNLDNTEAQLALIDPNRNEGAVLGAATEMEESFPLAEQIYTDAILNQIKVKTVFDNSPEAITRYAQSVAAVEAQYEAVNIIASINSDNAEELSKVPKQVEALNSGLAALEVPAELVEYHKLKLLYYATVSKLSEIFNGTDKNFDMQTASTAWFSLMERMGRISAEVYQKHNVILQ